VWVGLFWAAVAGGIGWFIYSTYIIVDHEARAREKVAKICYEPGEVVYLGNEGDDQLFPFGERETLILYSCQPGAVGIGTIRGRKVKVKVLSRQKASWSYLTYVQFLEGNLEGEAAWVWGHHLWDGERKKYGIVTFPSDWCRKMVERAN
jgi:hypothetical protein